MVYIKHIFIINPNAGRGKDVRSFVRRIISTAKQTDGYELYATEKPNDATRYTRMKAELNEPIRFYACGGDGTLQEVISGMMGYNKCEVASIPIGSSNDFLRNFSNREFFFDLDRQISGKAALVDVISANDHYSINMLNVGLDAEVAANKDSFSHIPFLSGPMSYNAALAYCFFRKFGTNLQIKIGDETFDHNFVLAAFGNGTTYGGGYRATPNAVINDGLLDICLFKNIGRIDILKNISIYKNGQHLECESLKPHIIYRRAKEASIISEVPVMVCIDGEFFISRRINIKILPGAVNFVLPDGCAVIQ